MGNRLWCGVLLVGLTSGISSAQSTVLDLIEFAVPGISATPFCSVTRGECWFGGVQSYVFDDLRGGISKGNGFDADAVGARYFWDAIAFACSGTSTSDTRLSRVRPDKATELVLTVHGCVNGYPFASQIQGINLDTVNGSALLYVASTFGEDVVELHGLPALLDIIPTFQPATSTLGWVAPKHPEALPAADRFQVYTGDLADLRADRGFSSAVPVACAVPGATAPTPGDFLSILDPLPNPAPGQGSYAIIGTEYAGQRRFGRQNIGGVLSGRDPSALKGCT